MSFNRYFERLFHFGYSRKIDWIVSIDVVRKRSFRNFLTFNSFFLEIYESYQV